MEDVGAVYLPAVVPGGAERRRDDGASGKTDHAAFGTTLLGCVSWDHRDCFGGDAGDCAVFCVWKSENVGSEPASACTAGAGTALLFSMLEEM